MIGLLSVQLLGFFSIEQMAVLRTELASAIDRLDRGPGKHMSIYDISECKIQSQDVVNAFRSMSDAKHVGARRLAVVTGGSLMRMQLSRILVGRDTRVFNDKEDARRWLLSPETANMDVSYRDSPQDGRSASRVAGRTT